MRRRSRNGKKNGRLQTRAKAYAGLMTDSLPEFVRPSPKEPRIVASTAQGGYSWLATHANIQVFMEEDKCGPRETVVVLVDCPKLRELSKQLWGMKEAIIDVAGNDREQTSQPE